MDAGRYVKIFIDEANGHLRNLGECIGNLEQEPGRADSIDEMVHTVHSFGGMAQMMGFWRMQRLARGMEALILEVQSQKSVVTGRMIDVFSACLDALERYLEQIKKTQGEGTETHEALLKELKSCKAQKKEPDPGAKEKRKSFPAIARMDRKFLEIACLEQEKEALRDAVRKERHIYGFTVSISPDCLLKEARASLVLKAAEAFGSIPVCRTMRDEGGGQTMQSAISFFLISEEPLPKVVSAVKAVSEIQVEAAEEVKPDDILKQGNGVKEPEAWTERAASEKIRTGCTVRVDGKKLDDLMQQVSELMMIKDSMVSMYASKEDGKGQIAYAQIEYLESVTANLLKSVMQVRMVPMERVVNRFPRMIRDFARKLHKHMELYISGMDTTLDRTVADQMERPIWHLLEYLAEHGIESEFDRRAQGKPRKGVIYLNIYAEADSVILDMHDDGNGMAFAEENKSAVCGAALKGAYAAVEAVGGEIRTCSAPGKSSGFIVRLPLALAVVKALVALVHQERYAVALGMVQRAEEFSPEDVHCKEDKEWICLHDMEIPLIRLDRVLDMGPSEQKGKTQTAIIVKKGERYAGLVVDRLVGQQEIVVKPLGPFLQSEPMIHGAAVLGNGSLALILDVNALL